MDSKEVLDDSGATKWKEARPVSLLGGEGPGAYALDFMLNQVDFWVVTSASINYTST